MGVASRRGADLLIQEGKVKVNGQIVTELGTKVNLDKDQIFIEGKPIPKRVQKEYYIMNKPKGYVCSNTRFDNEKIVFDLVNTKAKKLFTIGRLDKDTRGLLLLTNDGDFSQRVIHPSSSINKEYIAKVKREITEDDLKLMSKGVFIEGRRVTPKKIEKIRKGTLRVVLTDGKNHEVKALLEKADLPLHELKRVRIGNLYLGTLPEGSYRSLTPKEQELIFE